MVFKRIGPDRRIVVDADDDPGVQGVTCCVSRAGSGGIQGGLGLGEDKAEASIAGRQKGAIPIAKPVQRQHDMFGERISRVFKRLRFVRMLDVQRNPLVDLGCSGRLIEGPRRNSVTAVPVDRATSMPLRQCRGCLAAFPVSRTPQPASRRLPCSGRLPGHRASIRAAAA